MSRGRRRTTGNRAAQTRVSGDYSSKTPATWQETNVYQSIHPCLDQFAPQGSTRRGTTFGRRRAPPPALGAPSLCSVDALALQMRVAKVGRNLAPYLACTYCDCQLLESTARTDYPWKSSAYTESSRYRYRLGVFLDPGPRRTSIHIGCPLFKVEGLKPAIDKFGDAKGRVHVRGGLFQRARLARTKTPRGDMAP
jgi:hypothetical protein